MKRLLIGTATLGIALGFGVAPAGAQTANNCANVSPTPAECLPQGEVASEVISVDEVAAQTVTPRPAAAQTLPVTGGDVVGLAAMGAGAVGAGAGLLAARRRKSA